MATLARYQAEKRSKNKETEEAIAKLSENLARLNWTPLCQYGNIKLKTSLCKIATLARYQAEKRSKNKETEEAITKLSENLARLNWTPLCQYGNIKLKTSLCKIAILACYKAEKRPKNKETEEAITKLSENLARLNWQPFCQYGNIGQLSNRKKIKEIEEAIKTSLCKWQPWPAIKRRKDPKTKKLRKLLPNYQKTLAGWIENLFENLETLAYYQAEKRLKK